MSVTTATSNDSNSATAGSEAPTVALPRRRSDTKSIARAVVRYRKNRAADLKRDLEDNITVLKQKEHTMKRERIALIELKKTKKNLQNVYNDLVLTKRSELVEKYRKDVTKLKQHPFVELFEVDIERRVVITTRPITIKQEGWTEEKIAGRYQIRIDFSKSSYEEAIRILNITQRHGYYDSPTITNTDPCWGNTRDDLDKEFKEQNLFELVIDLIDYISSPLDHHGYSRWDQFFAGAKPWPEGFSFEQHDQNEASKKVSGISVNENGAVTYQPATISNRVTSLNQIDSAMQWNGSVTSATYIGGTNTASGRLTLGAMHTQMDQYLTADVGTYRAFDRRVMDQYQYEVMENLKGLGFKENSAYHFMSLFTIEGVPLFQIELRYGEDYIEMIIVRTLNERVQRYFANHSDLEPEHLSRLMEHGRLTYRFASRPIIDPARWAVDPDEAVGAAIAQAREMGRPITATEEMAARRSRRTTLPETHWTAEELQEAQTVDERRRDRLFGVFTAQDEPVTNTEEDLSPSEGTTITT